MKIDSTFKLIAALAGMAVGFMLPDIIDVIMSFFG